MKIAVTATEPSLDAAVDPRFGRCAYFLIVSTEDLSFEAMENSNAGLSGGAGIQSAQRMSQTGVKAVLTGNCGPNAHQTLVAAGIEVITGCAGRVRDVVEQFKAGGLRPAAEPNVETHFGMGSPPEPNQIDPVPPPSMTQRGDQAPVSGAGGGRGRGGGRGKGGGMGRGGGRGGRGQGMGGGQGRGGGRGRG